MAPPACRPSTSECIRASKCLEGGGCQLWRRRCPPPTQAQLRETAAGGTVPDKGTPSLALATGAAVREMSRGARGRECEQVSLLKQSNHPPSRRGVSNTSVSRRRWTVRMTTGEPGDSAFAKQTICTAPVACGSKGDDKTGDRGRARKPRPSPGRCCSAGTPAGPIISRCSIDVPLALGTESFSFSSYRTASETHPSRSKRFSGSFAVWKFRTSRQLSNVQRVGGGNAFQSISRN